MNQNGCFDYYFLQCSTNAKQMVVRIYSKFSVKCEAGHKTIVKVDFLMFVTFK